MNEAKSTGRLLLSEETQGVVCHMKVNQAQLCFNNFLYFYTGNIVLLFSRESISLVLWSLKNLTPQVLTQEVSSGFNLQIASVSGCT